MGKLVKLVLILAIAYGVYLTFFQAEWYSAGSAKEGFTVDFPQQPKRDANRSNLKNFGITSVTNYVYQKGYVGFVATVLTSDKIRKGVITEKQIEEGAIDQLTKATTGRLIATKTGTHRGLPYTELEYRLDDSTATLYIRTFFTDGRIYFFMAASHTMDRMTSGRGRFFKSIRFPKT